MPPPNLSAILDRPIREFDLPVRMLAFAMRRGLHALRELAGLDPWLLLGEPNLAYTSLKATSRQMKRETGLTWERLVTQLTGVRCPALRLNEARAIASKKRRVV